MIPLRRRHVRLIVAAAIVGAIGVVAVVIGRAAHGPERMKGLVVELGGYALIACAGYALYTALRIRRHPAFELRIGLDELRAPHYPLSLGRSIGLRYRDIDRLSSTPAWLLIAARGRVHRVPLSLLPAAWAPADVVSRILLRWKLARAGTADPIQVAGAEALLLADRPGLGAVVAPGPTVLGVVDLVDDFLAIEHADAHLVVPADVAAGLREELRDRVIAHAAG